MRILATFLFLLLFTEASAQVSKWGSLGYRTVGFEIHIVGCDRNATGSLVIPEEIDELPVTKILNNAFDGCQGLSAIQIPDSVREIQSKAFQSCSGLLGIAIPPKASIGETLFYGCTKLTVVDWPASITVVPRETFLDCKGLKSINLPNGVTELAKFAFSGSGLESIILPESVAKIGGFALANCQSLRSVSIPKATKEIESNAFGGSLYLTQVRIPERYHSESEAIRIGLETAWPNGFLLQDAELTGPEESLEIRLAPVVTVKGVPGEVKTIDVADSPDGPWKLWRIVIVATGGAAEVDLDEGAERRFYRIRP